MLAVGGDGQSTIYTSAIDGQGGLVKQGTGTLTLTATSTYRGPTVIAGGTLMFRQPVTGSTGIHFIGNASSFTGTGGVVPSGNWNNESGYIFSGSPLTDSSGINRGTTLSLSGASSVWSTGNTNQLLNGYAASANTPMTLTLTGIPYSRYSLYIYVGDSTAGNHEEATINGTSYYYATEGAPRSATCRSPIPVPQATKPATTWRLTG